ncbi:hypothetical protein DSM104299_05674 [Baekduia alba]|uniref:RDD family protein n=1 Tax=Baekduia alba TaxID=2997333 RepID=UPI002340CEA2|nr:RDD family protein [Baekduia alba]WCB96904.1 hypothetical protein DSM104299_05674 [Baekduia alba]
MLGLRVVRADDGGKPTARAILVRNTLRLVDGLPILYLVGFITMLATPTRQRVGDLAASTVVGKA